MISSVDRKEDNNGVESSLIRFVSSIREEQG